VVDKTCLRRPEKLSTDRKAFIVELRGHQVEPHTHIGLVFDWTMGSCQVNLFKTWPGCSDVCSSSRKPVILSVVIAATVIVLALFLLFVLLPSQMVASHSGETL